MKPKFIVGERVKYVGYPVVTFGVITTITADGYAVHWEGGPDAFFLWTRPPNEVGTVVRAEKGEGK